MAGQRARRPSRIAPCHRLSRQGRGWNSWQTRRRRSFSAHASSRSRSSPSRASRARRRMPTWRRRSAGMRTAAVGTIFPVLRVIWTSTPRQSGGRRCSPAWAPNITTQLITRWRWRPGKRPGRWAKTQPARRARPSRTARAGNWPICMRGWAGWLSWTHSSNPWRGADLSDPGIRRSSARGKVSGR